MSAAPPALPLCVDLDRTLVRTDVFVEQLAARVTRGKGLLGLFSAALAGPAALKRHVAEHEKLDPSILPYHHPLLDYIRGERRLGRRIVLATAADDRVAEAIATHLGVFDEVLASDGSHNLKGRHKAERLVERFGPGGFVYAADSRGDLVVWRRAAAAVLVGASAAVTRAAARIVPIERTFPRSEAASWRGLLRAMRPMQWVKNVLVFVPVLASRSYDDMAAWANAGGIFLAFCALASSAYLTNDLLDLTSDRIHPTKRNRPLAAGLVPLPMSLLASVLLLGLGITLSAVFGALAPALAYFGATIAYSARLKDFPLVDIFVLASLYTVRVVAGGVASGRLVSQWLLAFCGFLFLALAAMKRVAELRARGADNAPNNQRRAYGTGDVGFLETFGMAASLTSSVVLAVFVQAHSASVTIPNPVFFGTVVPLVLFWQMRLWLATWRGYMLEDPIVYALRDWVTRLLALSTVIVFILSGYRLVWLF